MTFTIKINCKAADNAKLISSIVPYIAGLKFEIAGEAEQQEPAKRQTQQPAGNGMEAGAAEKGFQPLGERKRQVYVVYAKYPEDFVAKKQVEKESGLTSEQVRSVISDGVMRNELVPEQPGSTTHHRITQRGLERLKVRRE